MYEMLWSDLQWKYYTTNGNRTLFHDQFLWSSSGMFRGRFGQSPERKVLDKVETYDEQMSSKCLQFKTARNMRADPINLYKRTRTQDVQICSVCVLEMYS